MAAVVVDAVVERPQGPLEPEPREQRTHAREQRPGRAGEEEDDQQERAEDERALEPEVGADVVVADREHEADRAEQHRRGPAEAALDEDDRRQVARATGVPLRGLEDPHRVAADRRRQDLAGGVRDEVRPRQPPEPVDDPLRASSHCQRSAIGSAVTIMIVTASANHHRFADVSTSHVCWRSILSRM